MDRILRVILIVPTAVVFGLTAPAIGLAADSAATSGPEPSSRLQIVRRLPSEALAEMPLAEETHAAPPARAEAPPREFPASMASPLKTAEPLRERSEQLELVARQADRQTRHGFELAGRGAYFAARSEFLGALRLIAGSLDTEHKTTNHGRALAAALTAMKEAEDFLPNGPRLEAELDLPRVIAAHATPVLKSEAKNVTSMTALKCYFTFAQEQFAAAAGREVAGSMALHALGKLHDALAGKKGLSEAAAAPKAMVYYQAALLAYPKNYLAANDLGVLLARSGNQKAARKMLEYSLSLSRQSTTWRNLAVVYRQLGQTALADRAEREAAMIEQAEIARRKASSVAGNAAVRWVDPQTLARTSRGAPNSPGATPPPAQTAAKAPPSENRATGRRWPAPTPAAAERMSWGSTAKQK